jgi:hypothetical protein
MTVCALVVSFSACCCADMLNTGGVLKSQQACVAAVPAVCLGVELLQLLERPDIETEQVDEAGVLRSCAAFGFNLVQQLVAKIEAAGHCGLAAVTESDAKELLASDSSCPELLRCCCCLRSS